MKHSFTTLGLLLAVSFIWFSGMIGGISTSALAATPATVPVTTYLLFSGSELRHPFPQHVQYAPDTIRPNHRSQIQQDNDVRAAYDRWKAHYLVTVSGSTPSGGALYRVSYGSLDPSRTVSEGQGYGMVIVALMAGHDPDAQSIFDGLWYFSRNYSSSIDSRLMTWQIPEDLASGADSAFDGDADIAYGLLLAYAQWGSHGNVNYAAAANVVITAIKESTIGPESYLPMLGDWVSSSDEPYNQYTSRSSDFMPAHFRAFAEFSGDETWMQVVSAVQDAIGSMQSIHSPDTGLLPDFMVPVSATDHSLKPAPPHFLEGPHDGDYDYNAGRDPWRIATDALLNNNADSLKQARRMADWIVKTSGGNPSAIKSGYTLNGTPTNPDNDFTTFFAAPFGAALMTTPGHQQFLNDVYDAVVDVQEDYYEDSVTLLCLLLMTGNYWNPN